MQDAGDRAACAGADIGRGSCDGAGHRRAAAVIAAAILPTPCATNSLLDRWRRPDMPSATTAESSDSIAPRMAIANASGSTALDLLEAEGRECRDRHAGLDGAEARADGLDIQAEQSGEGGRAPHRRSAEPASSAAACRISRMAAIENTESATVIGLMVPSAAHRAFSFGTVSAGSLVERQAEQVAKPATPE